MEAKPLKILDSLEDSIETFLSDYESKMPSANQEIYNELEEFLGTLKRRADGTIKASVDNLKLVDKYRATLDKAIGNGSYTDATKEFIGTFKETSGFVNNYFGEIVNTFNSNNALYQEILKSNVESTVQSLLGSGLDANFKEPVIKILKDSIINGSDTKGARQALTDFIIGSKDVDPKLTRYVKQVSNDSIRQYNRNYTKVISDDLNLSHYFFKGTKIKDTRTFCAARVGKYFTKKEVEGWASKEWAGKNTATTKATIFTLVGGYGCRHDLIPVSKELYDKFNK